MADVLLGNNDSCRLCLYLIYSSVYAELPVCLHSESDEEHLIRLTSQAVNAHCLWGVYTARTINRAHLERVHTSESQYCLCLCCWVNKPAALISLFCKRKCEEPRACDTQRSLWEKCLNIKPDGPQKWRQFFLIPRMFCSRERRRNRSDVV